MSPRRSVLRADKVRFRDLPPFDTSTLSPQARAWFDNIQARIREVADSMIGAYRPSDCTLTISGCYKHTTTFNAAVWQEDDRLVVGMGASVALLLEMLFWAMLADSEVLPSLPPGRRNDSAKAVFAVDPRNTQKLSQYRASLSDERAAAAHVLADLCVSFIYLHELGHVVCGHVGATAHHFGETQLVEFAAPRSRVRAPDRDRRARQYWEYQADAIAAMLLPQYVDTLIARLDVRHGWIRSLVRGRSGLKALRLHLGALTVMAVSAMFVYLEGGRLRAREVAWHPHPIVRSLYLKDVFAREAARRWGYRPSDLGRLQYGYLEPFLFALERHGVGSVRTWDPDLLDDFQKEATRLGHGGQAYRDLARPWSWVPVDSWG
jgi:hypothetical protein